jgi:hypothetical protein
VAESTESYNEHLPKDISSLVKRESYDVEKTNFEIENRSSGSSY